jgi:hypothetical protein
MKILIEIDKKTLENFLSIMNYRGDK